MSNQHLKRSWLIALLISAIAGFFALSQLLSSPAEAKPSAPPDNTQALFKGQTEVSVDEFFSALKAQVPQWASAPAVEQDYQQFLKQYALSNSATLYQDYVRVRLAFEATRAGGLWSVAWNITDQLPQSDKVWQQWQKVSAQTTLNTTTAIAECDELSALFAVVARGIGLSKDSDVGLLWPTSNHTVAVWVPNKKSAKPVRVVVPTSQIFLDSAQSLGTSSFDPWRQKSIFDYRRVDVTKQTKLPAALARLMLKAVQDNANVSQKNLQLQRNQREQAQRGA